MKNLADSPERSIVTVLAVDTVNSTGHIAGEDPDDAEELLDQIYKHLNGAVKRAGGLFVNFSGDGGIAVFGWPDSLEDHADRACEAAWLIHQPALEAQPICDGLHQPISFRVGIHSGLIGLRRMDMEIGARVDPVGGTVHLAAQLQKTAEPNGTVISSKTLALCRTEQEVAPLDSLPFLTKIRAKAFLLHARPHQPGARPAPRTYRLPLVGRLDEYETLRAALVGTGQGHRAFALIGEPGIGKSRLTAAVIEDAVARGMTALTFFGDSKKRTTPYSAMRSLIFDVLSLSDTAADDEVLQAMAAAGFERLEDNPQDIVLLTRREGPRSGNVTQTQIARALVETLTRLTQDEPTLIVIEDLHLLDLESIHCLRLIGEQKSASLLLTGRPESLADSRRIADTVLRLAPLARAEMRELARQLWPLGTPPRAVVEKVLDRADGVPFVLEQIVLSIDGDNFDDIDLAPHSVQSVIHARLNRLSAGAKAFAQALSVLGEEVDVDVARRALRTDAETLQRDRDELERLEIVHSSSGPAIRFRHAIVAEACSETVPGARRRELHRAAMDTIASMYADLGAQYERLAFHAEGARAYEQELDYLWMAGLRARRGSATGSLFLIFQRAMQCVERIGEPAEEKFVDFVLMAFAQLLQIGEFRKMNPYLPRALELAQRQSRPDKVCAALCHMGMVSWFEGRYADGLGQMERAMKIADSMGNPPLIFAAKFMLASVLHGMGEVNKAIGLLFELSGMLTGKLATARLGATAVPRSIVHSYLSWFMMDVGRYDEGLKHVELGLEIAKQEAEPYSELLARIGMGRNLLKLKRHRDAADCLEVAITLIEQNGYDPALPHVTGLLASALAGIGEAQRAVRMVEAWLALGQQERTGRQELYHLNAGYAEALLRLGDTEAALAAAQRGLEVGWNINNPCLIVQGLSLRTGILSKVKPDSAQINLDRVEMHELCQRFGLVA